MALGLEFPEVSGLRERIQRKTGKRLINDRLERAKHQRTLQTQRAGRLKGQCVS